MAEDKPKRGPGRPKAVISDEDLAKAEEYALQNCKNNTIATLMGWHPMFIAEHEEILKRLRKKRAEHAQTIRESQFNHVKNPIMAMFLGKNVLGQADKQDIKHGMSEDTLSLLSLIDGKTRNTLPGEAGDNTDSLQSSGDKGRSE